MTASITPSRAHAIGSRSRPTMSIALHVLERIFHLAVNVLNQRAAAIHIQRLYAETNRQHRKPPCFGRCEQHHIGFVAPGNHWSEFRFWFVSVSKRIYIVNRSRQAKRVRVGHHGFNVFGLGNQRQKQGCAAGRVDRFAIRLAQFVVESSPVIPARNDYNWSVVSGQVEPFQ